MLTLREGISYKSHNGLRFGPMKKSDRPGMQHLFTDDNRYWTANGKFSSAPYHPYDLVCEWEDGTDAAQGVALAGKPADERSSFQQRVGNWMVACFGEEISSDPVERCDRFVEEALEMVQAGGYERERAHALVDYVFDREKGDTVQEVGGVMVTLAAWCNVFRVDIEKAADRELSRVWEKIEKIRAKHKAKPTGSALPSAVAPSASVRVEVGYRPLFEVLSEALDQAQAGKGVKRHGNGLPFVDQPIMEIARRRGPGFPLGQVEKKTDEAHGMISRKEYDAAEQELLGAIVYLAASVLIIREKKGAGE